MGFSSPRRVAEVTLSGDSGLGRLVLVMEGRRERSARHYVALAGDPLVSLARWVEYDEQQQDPMPVGGLAGLILAFARARAGAARPQRMRWQ